ncbi:MAG: ferrochelatase [Bacteroidales bacterium]|jgi:ferrochelatase|nr:ferrochelatase [Bacteroidales bacterium]
MTGVLLVNIGTPQSPTRGAVRRYLWRLLGQQRVMGMPFIMRKALVGLIALLRAPRSARLYREIWTSDGSPILAYAKQCAAALQKKLGDGYQVFSVMSYGVPSLDDTLRHIEGRFDRLLIVPLFPQYAASTSGAILENVFRHIAGWNIFPEIRTLSSFYAHPLFISAFAAQISKCCEDNFEHVIFSFHGVPLSHINRIHPHVSVDNCLCMRELPTCGQHCYRAMCYETARLLARELNLSDKDYTVTFQSRMANGWTRPFTDAVIIEKAKEGCRTLLVVAPSFVADCLETIHEIGIQYRDLFLKHGGQSLRLAESLNANPIWIDCLKQLVCEGFLS